MRTNIEIDDALLSEAMRLSGLKTKRAVVEEGLRKLIRLKGQEEILKLSSKIRWEGNLDESRLGPVPRNPRSSKPQKKKPAKEPTPRGPRR